MSNRKKRLARQQARQTLNRSLNSCGNREPLSNSIFHHNKQPNVTAAITYFIRPQSLARLLQSLHNYHYGIPIVMEDTTEITYNLSCLECKKDFYTYIPECPFCKSQEIGFLGPPKHIVDGNLSAARNRLYRRIDTEYFLMLEEDMELTSPLPLDKCLEILEHDTSIWGVSGNCYELDKGKVMWKHDFNPDYEGSGDSGLGISPSQKTPRTTGTGVVYQPCDLVLNFGVFRTSIIDHTQWDESLPIMEHREFFFEASQNRGMQFAYLPEMTVKHYKDRPHNIYNKLRGRDLNEIQSRKHGVDFSVYYPRQDTFDLDRPNIILIGVGHSNTTLTVRQLISLGWQSNSLLMDQEYLEPVSIREANDWFLKRGVFPDPKQESSMENRLATFRQPWVLKDPRFTRVAPIGGVSPLSSLKPLLAPYAPLLLWVVKDQETVKASYSRRGESPEGVEKNYRWCEREFENWPWSKLQLRAEDIGSACMLYDHQRGYFQDLERGRPQ